MYCKKCGGKVESYASNCPFCGEKVVGNGVQATYTEGNTIIEGKHRSAGKWLLTYIVLSIPVLNFIMLCVWAFGKGSKADPTFRSWAKLMFVLVMIGVVLSVAVAVLAVVGVVNLPNNIPEGLGA